MELLAFFANYPVSRPNKRVIAIKTIEQQDIKLVHKIRKGLVDQRTARVNQLRGLLSERGLVIHQGINRLRKQLPLILEDAENALMPLSGEVFAEYYVKLQQLDDAIKEQDQRISLLCRENDRIRRFLEVPGVGPMTASIVDADIGQGKGYRNSRDYVGSLGIVPRQHSSGGKDVYLGISKRGNQYIRILLKHGAWAVLKN